MPFSYARTKPHVRDEILARIAAGERLKAICAEPRMPCCESVTLWARRDPDYGAAYVAAKRNGEWRRLYMFDDAKARRLIARMAAGETISSILRDPDMPGWRTYTYWRRTQVGFQEELHRVKGSRAELRAERLRGRRREFDPAVADRVYARLWRGERLRQILASDKAFPSLAVLERWRREQPEFDRMLRFVLKGWNRKRGQERCLCTPELTDAIVDQIVQGHSLRSLGRLPDMPSAGTLYNWVRTRPEFAARVAEACEDREDWYNDQLLDISMIAVPGAVGAARKQMAPLNSQLARLRKRPGWKRRREGR